MVALDHGQKFLPHHLAVLDLIDSDFRSLKTLAGILIGHIDIETHDKSIAGDKRSR